MHCRLQNFAVREIDTIQHNNKPNDRHYYWSNNDHLVHGTTYLPEVIIINLLYVVLLCPVLIVDNLFPGGTFPIGVNAAQIVGTESSIGKFSALKKR